MGGLSVRVDKSCRDTEFPSRFCATKGFHGGTRAALDAGEAVHKVPESILFNPHEIPQHNPALLAYCDALRKSLVVVRIGLHGAVGYD
jgi:hypothetical protein